MKKEEEMNQSGTVGGEGYKRDVTSLFIKGEQPEVQPTGGGQSLASSRSHITAGIHAHQWAFRNTPSIRGAAGGPGGFL